MVYRHKISTTLISWSKLWSTPRLSEAMTHWTRAMSMKIYWCVKFGGKCGSGKCRSVNLWKAVRIENSKIPVVYAQTVCERCSWRATWCTYPGSVRTHGSSSLAVHAHRLCQPTPLTPAKCVSWHRVTHASRWCRAVISVSASRVLTQCTTKAVAVLFAAHPSHWCCVCTNLTYSPQCNIINSIS